MKRFGTLALAMCCGAAALLGTAQAAPMAGLSLAATSVQELTRPAVTDVVPDTVHYRRHRHGHCLASFYRCSYGVWPRYYYPSYRPILDGYTFFYPPFYW